MFQVAEKFVSINGESIRAGEPAVFIRFRGCNLCCGYCDTKWANAPDCPVTEMSAEDIVGYACGTGIINVTLTGGEPLLQKDLPELTDALISAGRRVEIETNGSLPIEELACREIRPAFTLDYKLPSSGMESSMLTDNYRFLTDADAVKFVAGSREDLHRADDIIREFSLAEKCRVFISPVFGKLRPDEIVDHILANRMNDIKVQLQLHKFIWDPDMRGV